MSSMTMRRDGSFVVELIHPLKDNGRDVAEIAIAPANYDHTIRWGEHRISSFMALLAEMSGVRERTLKLLVYPDVDRVMFAFIYMMPPSIQTDFQNGARMLASPEDELVADDPEPASDQIDPRFPHSPNVTKRFDKPPVFKAGPQPPPASADPMGLDDPVATTKVA